LIHADLAGNVLFADGLQPAVFDEPVIFMLPAYLRALALSPSARLRGTEGPSGVP
jgi:prepilin-type processing-associated H-X9-DG protein